MQRTPFWVAHEDYLQTVVEWGYIGAALWAVILVPGAFSLLSGVLRRSSENRSPDDFGYEFGWGDRLSRYFEAIPTASSPLVQGGSLCRRGVDRAACFRRFPDADRVAPILFF